MRLHEGEPALVAGAPLERARAAVVALHGRGASAQDILGFLTSELGEHLDQVAFVAPQARHSTWYPKSFLAPFEENQPWLDSALARVADVLAEVEAKGVPRERILLFGFSQGACLASETLARTARPLGALGALVAATGGRIGPPGTSFAIPPELAGTVESRPLAGVPVHLSAGDPDPHVPWSRVEETAAAFRAAGAEVVTRREPGFPHSVHPAAVAFARLRLGELSRLSSSSPR